MNNTEALNIIYKHLKAGHKFGKWIDNVRYPYFEVNLVMSLDGKYWRWQKYGSSANRANKKELKWVIETVFNMKPVVFLEEYQCRDKFNRLVWEYDLERERLFEAMRNDLGVMAEWGDNEEGLRNELETCDDEIIKEYKKIYLSEQN